MFLTYDELFLETINDLRGKLSSGKDYELVRAAGLCRHLLTDKHPFISTLNREYKLPIRFTVSTLVDIGLHYTKMDMVWTSIVPSDLATNKAISLQEFLAIKFLKIGEHLYTVKDIIRAASHAMGGIHSYEPKDEKEAALGTLERRLVGDGHRTIAIAIASICKVVIAGMEPFENAIRAKLSH